LTGKVRAAMKTRFIRNDAAYGTERRYNGVRLAGSLPKVAGAVKLFLPPRLDDEAHTGGIEATLKNCFNVHMFRRCVCAINIFQLYVDELTFCRHIHKLHSKLNSYECGLPTRAAL
jgi:hypothetical protein